MCERARDEVTYVCVCARASVSVQCVSVFERVIVCVCKAGVYQSCVCDFVSVREREQVLVSTECA